MASRDRSIYLFRAGDRSMLPQSRGLLPNLPSKLFLAIVSAVEKPIKRFSERLRDRQMATAKNPTLLTKTLRDNKMDKSRLKAQTESLPKIDLDRSLVVKLGTDVPMRRYSKRRSLMGLVDLEPRIIKPNRSITATSLSHL